MKKANLPIEWHSSSIGAINTYESFSMQPEKYAGTVFELYSVPIFPEGKPEILKAEEIGSNKQFVQPNDILVCKINPRINRVWSVPEFKELDQIASSEWIVVRQKAMNSQYLTWYFRSDEFRTRLCADVTGVGGSLTRAQPKQVAKFPLPIPPLAEQKVIAEKLDTLLAQVETTKARLERIPQILKHFRQSVLTAAVSGRLTEEWGTENKTKLSEISIKITDGEHITPKFLKEGVPLLSAKDVREDKLLLSDCKFVSMETAEKALARCDPRRGDLLVVSRGATVGRTHLIETDEIFCLMGSVLLIRPDPAYIIPRYMEIALKEPAGQKQLTSLSGASAQQAIYIRDIKIFELSIPPLPHQIKIVYRVKQLFDFVEDIEQKANTALERVNNLTQSILAKAFKGELTTHWRAANPDLISGENSAEALLEKIKLEHERSRNQPRQKQKIEKNKGNSMSKQIIKVTEALRAAGKPLSGQELLIAAGYPNDCNTEDLERFFLDIRESLSETKSIEKQNRTLDGQDWFNLSKSA